MRTPSRIIYGVIIGFGIVSLIVILNQTKQACVTSEKVCFTYRSGWKATQIATPSAIRVVKTKPGAIFQLVVSHSKVTGSVQSVATSIDAKLKKQLKNYKFISAHQIVVDKVRAVEITYEFTPANGRQVTQQLVVAPIGDLTYLFTTETSPSDLAKVQADYDYMLRHVEIKK